MMRGASCVKNMLWQKAVFNNNTAGEDGGAMYLDEIINRNITGQADFNHNTVSTCMYRCNCAFTCTACA